MIIKAIKMDAQQLNQSEINKAYISKIDSLNTYSMIYFSPAIHYDYLDLAFNIFMLQGVTNMHLKT